MGIYQRICAMQSRTTSSKRHTLRVVDTNDLTQKKRTEEQKVDIEFQECRFRLAKNVDTFAQVVGKKKQTDRKNCQIVVPVKTIPIH